MLFGEYFMKACNEVIDCTNTGIWYLEPDYEALLEDAGLKLENVSDREMTIAKVREMLDLRVQQLNARANKSRIVLDWIYDVITTKAEPKMLEEETELFKNIAEYLKESKNIEGREKELDERENKLDVKENLASKMPTMLNFSKRKPNE